MKIIKNIITIFIVLLICVNTSYSQKLIRVDSIPYNYLKELFPYELRNSQTQSYYKIFHVQQDSILTHNNYIDFFKRVSVKDTVKLIEELLMLKGDIRRCAIPIVSYSINAYHSYTATTDTIRFCNIEVEALFLINQLLSDKPIRQQSYPLLVMINKGKKVDANEITKRAYLAYGKWFKKAKKFGLYWTKRHGLYPLKGSGVKWYN
jgi:hypothetical protein